MITLFSFLHLHKSGIGYEIRGPYPLLFTDIECEVMFDLSIHSSPDPLLCSFSSSTSRFSRSSRHNKLRSVFDPCSLPFSSLLKRDYFHKLANTNSQTACSFLLPMCLLLCDYLHCCCCLPPCLLIVLVLHFKFPRLRCSCISINKLHHSPCRTMAPILPRTPSHNGSSGLKQLEGT